MRQLCSGRDKRGDIKRVSRHYLQGKMLACILFFPRGIWTFPVFRGRVENLYARRHIAATDAKFEYAIFKSVLRKKRGKHDADVRTFCASMVHSTTSKHAFNFNIQNRKLIFLLFGNIIRDDAAARKEYLKMT